MTYRHATVGIRPFASLCAVLRSSPFCTFVFSRTLCVTLIVVSVASAQARVQNSDTVQQKASSDVASRDFHPTPQIIIEKDIDAGVTHSSHPILKEGQYLQFVVECWGINIAIAVYDPNGAAISKNVCYRGGLTPVSAVAEVSGPYK